MNGRFSSLLVHLSLDSALNTRQFWGNMRNLHFVYLVRFHSRTPFFLVSPLKTVQAESSEPKYTIQ